MFDVNKTFKAAVLTKQKKRLKILKLSPKLHLERGQVLVKILSTSICGAQIGEIQGKTGKDKWIPHCLGHEGFGIIIKKNKSDNKFKINDQVIMHWRKSDGINSKPTSYLNGKKIINAGLITTFQEYAVVSENRLSKVNNFKRYKDIAPLLGCALTTSWGILNKEAKIYHKDKLLIFGAGGIGLSLGVIAKIQKSKYYIN